MSILLSLVKLTIKIDVFSDYEAIAQRIKAVQPPPPPKAMYEKFNRKNFDTEVLENCCEGKKN